MMISQPRTRADILADLQRYRHEAGQLTVKDERYPIVHAIIDGLLTELEWLEA